jgi:putative hydrolase of HD superfamily
VSGSQRDITGFRYEIGLLKRYPRTGWSLAGVPDAESVAEHSFRASVVASVLAALEGADPQRAAFLALWHDTLQTRTTDLPHLARRYVTAAANETVTGDQVRPLPEPAASMIRGAVAEYEAGQTPEARAARDADKLECLLQAREYADQGHQNLQPWIDSSLASLRTATAREIAAEALTQNSLDWLTRARQP